MAMANQAKQVASPPASGVATKWLSQWLRSRRSSLTIIVQFPRIRTSSSISRRTTTRSSKWRWILRGSRRSSLTIIVLVPLRRRRRTDFRAGTQIQSPRLSDKSSQATNLGSTWLTALLCTRKIWTRLSTDSRHTATKILR